MGIVVEFPSGEPIKVEEEIIPVRPDSNLPVLPPAVANLTPEEKELFREHEGSKGGKGRKNPHGELPEAVRALPKEQRELLEESRERPR